jgi:hypothetical protein
MATVNPAVAVRIDGRQRGIATGEKSDLVRFRWNERSHDLSVLESVISGEAVYKREVVARDLLS